jgi:hypothetical protein
MLVCSGNAIAESNVIRMRSRRPILVEGPSWNSAPLVAAARRLETYLYLQRFATDQSDHTTRANKPEVVT